MVGAIFSRPIQTGPEAQAPGLFPEDKTVEGDVDHPPPSSTEVKDRVQLHLYCALCASKGKILDDFYLYL